MKMREINHAETTRPTKTPEGSRSCAKMGRKEAEKLIPIMIEKPMTINSKNRRGYELKPKAFHATSRALKRP